VTPLPAPLGGEPVTAWRLDLSQYAGRWDIGEGAYRFGGRWNSKGVRAVYCCLDPATAILEVAVHTGFATLDTTPHVLTALAINDASDIHVLWPQDVPNPHWLHPGPASAGQQAFGDDLMARYRFVAVPSAVSTHSWNLLFNPEIAVSCYTPLRQEPFALDPRLHPPTPRSPPP